MDIFSSVLYFINSIKSSPGLIILYFSLSWELFRAHSNQLELNGIFWTIPWLHQNSCLSLYFGHGLSAVLDCCCRFRNSWLCCCQGLCICDFQVSFSFTESCFNEFIRTPVHYFARILWSLKRCVQVNLYFFDYKKVSSCKKAVESALNLKIKVLTQNYLKKLRWMINIFCINCSDYGRSYWK